MKCISVFKIDLLLKFNSEKIVPFLENWEEFNHETNACRGTNTQKNVLFYVLLIYL